MKTMKAPAICALALVAASPAVAWESANDGGRVRHFINWTIDLNMRAWPAPTS